MPQIDAYARYRWENSRRGAGRVVERRRQDQGKIKKKHNAIEERKGIKERWKNVDWEKGHFS